MSYTLTAILEQVRDLIGDTSAASPNYDDATLTGFINRAIEDISQHFPRRTTYTLSTTAGERVYELVNTHLQVLSVEYPSGRTPPAYLARRPYTDPEFWTAAAGAYDFIQTKDSSSANPPRLILSPCPADDETITLELTTEHAALNDPSDVCTLLERHIHLIGLFVRWKIWQRLASQEAADPDPLHLLAATQELNAGRAEDAYRRALAAAQQSGSTSEPADWKMDPRDRIY